MPPEHPPRVRLQPARPHHPRRGDRRWRPAQGNPHLRAWQGLHHAGQGRLHREGEARGLPGQARRPGEHQKGRGRAGEASQGRYRGIEVCGRGPGSHGRNEEGCPRVTCEALHARRWPSRSSPPTPPSRRGATGGTSRTRTSSCRASAGAPSTCSRRTSGECWPAASCHSWHQPWGAAHAQSLFSAVGLGFGAGISSRPRTGSSWSSSRRSS